VYKDCSEAISEESHFIRHQRISPGVSYSAIAKYQSGDIYVMVAWMRLCGAKLHLRPPEGELLAHYQELWPSLVEMVCCGVLLNRLKLGNGDLNTPSLVHSMLQK
jgi:hypothetical protein